MAPLCGVEMVSWNPRPPLPRVRIDDRIYKTEEIRPAEPEPPLFQLTAEKTRLDEVLSLQMINELNINNTKTLEKLGAKENIQATLSYTLLSILLLLIAGLAIELIRRIKKAADEKKRTSDDNTPNNRTPPKSRRHELHKKTLTKRYQQFTVGPAEAIGHPRNAMLCRRGSYHAGTRRYPAS
ncbi:hypothetical protein ACLKA7_001906 [Drosophila subpalustris]